MPMQVMWRMLEGDAEDECVRAVCEGDVFNSGKLEGMMMQVVRMRVGVKMMPMFEHADPAIHF